MAEKAGKGQTALAVGFLTAGIIGIALTVRHFTSQHIVLYEGWNVVTYYGPEKPASEAFASIMEYVQIVYQWDGQNWNQVAGDTMMVKGEEYNIEVNQDCTWTF
jgi:hypothetical protein